MAPIQMKQMPDLSDDLRRDLESMYAPDTEATFQEQDKNGSFEMSSSYDAPRGVVTSEMAQGEPISPRELYSSDEVYAIAAEAARMQVEKIAPVKAVSSRIVTLRDRHAAN